MDIASTSFDMSFYLFFLFHRNTHAYTFPLHTKQFLLVISFCLFNCVKEVTRSRYFSLSLSLSHSLHSFRHFCGCCRSRQIVCSLLLSHLHQKLNYKHFKKWFRSISCPGCLQFFFIFTIAHTHICALE